MVQLYVENLKWALGLFIMELKSNEVLILGELILVSIRKMFVLAKIYRCTHMKILQCYGQEFKYPSEIIHFYKKIKFHYYLRRIKNTVFNILVSAYYTRIFGNFSTKWFSFLVFGCWEA